MTSCKVRTELLNGLDANQTMSGTGRSLIHRNIPPSPFFCGSSKQQRTEQIRPAPVILRRYIVDRHQIRSTESLAWSSILECAPGSGDDVDVAIYLGEFRAQRTYYTLAYDCGDRDRHVSRNHRVVQIDLELCCELYNGDRRPSDPCEDGIGRFDQFDCGGVDRHRGELTRAFPAAGRPDPL
jgi:hypothetical protein